ncbi:MAG: LOG family protein [Bacilli bacterium]|nr:LOG family protein [Bacilli bacterium]
MKVFIASAANLDLEEKYMNLAREVSEIFAKNNFDLLFGAGHYSMMGECYKTFVKYKRKIYAYTVPKWERDFLRIPKAKCVKVNDTLLRFRKMYFASDIVVILPGGIGTLAEFTCAIEEYRSSGGNKRIILYNLDGYYDDILKFTKDNIDTKFFKDDLSDCYQVVTNLEELESIVEDYKKNYNLSKKFK